MSFVHCQSKLQFQPCVEAQPLKICCCWLSVNNNGTGWSRCEKFPLICDFAGSMYRVFDVDRNLLPKKRTGNLEADEIWISS